MKRSLALMACVLSSAMVLTTVSPVMAADKETQHGARGARARARGRR